MIRVLWLVRPVLQESNDQPAENRANQVAHQRYHRRRKWADDCPGQIPAEIGVGSRLIAQQLLTLRRIIPINAVRGLTELAGGGKRKSDNTEGASEHILVSHSLRWPTAYDKCPASGIIKVADRIDDGQHSVIRVTELESVAQRDAIHQLESTKLKAKGSGESQYHVVNPGLPYDILSLQLGFGVDFLGMGRVLFDTDRLCRITGSTKD